MIEIPFINNFHPTYAQSLICGALAACAGGMIGPLVVASRTVSMAGAVAHAAIGGIGATLFLRHKFPIFANLDPSVGALIVGFLSAIFLAWQQSQKTHSQHNTDTSAAVLWAVGMSGGLLLASQAGSYGELEGYLFGQISMNGSRQLWQMAILCAGILLVLLLQGKRIAASISDPKHAQLQGTSIFISNLILLGMVAIVTVCLSRVVGLILVLALVTLPAIAAKQLSSTLWRTIILSAILAIAAATVPRVGMPNLSVSPEPIIVLSSAIMLGICFILRKGRHIYTSRKSL